MKDRKEKEEVSDVPLNSKWNGKPIDNAAGVEEIATRVFQGHIRYKNSKSLSQLLIPHLNHF